MTTNGTIKRLAEKGFGFIATTEGVEYCCHRSACAGATCDNLREGQPVSFTVGRVRKGLWPRTSTCGDDVPSDRPLEPDGLRGEVGSCGSSRPAPVHSAR
jgi:CspA family cold shock protein